MNLYLYKYCITDLAFKLSKYERSFSCQPQASEHVCMFHINDIAEESDEWIKSSPFRFDGILHRGTAKVNPKSLEIENEELKRKNEALGEDSLPFSVLKYQ